MTIKKISFWHLTLAALFAGLWAIFCIPPVFADATKPPVSTAPPLGKTMPQISAIAPSFSLPIWSETKSPARWHSQDALGEAAIFLLLPGSDAILTNASALIEHRMCFQ